MINGSISSLSLRHPPGAVDFSPIQEAVRQAGLAMALQKDAVLREGIERHLGPVEDIRSLRGRLTMTNHADGTSVAAVDGVPVVYFEAPTFPLDLGFIKTQQRYRFLLPARVEEVICPACKGSGEGTAMTYGRGPDDYEVPCECSACGGSGVQP